MRKIAASLLRKVLYDQSGQILPWMAVGMTAFLGIAGLTIDVGNAYVVRGQLRNSTNAAALAAAGVVYNTSKTDNATAYATNYSSKASGDQNYNSRFGTVTTTVTPLCLNMLIGGSGCVASSSNADPTCLFVLCNAVRVTQTASVPTYFMKVFGYNSLTVSATATASMLSVAQPWNVAVVIDATGSMATNDSDCGGVTEFQCAMNGVQALLAAVNPCAGGASTCTTDTASLRVALFSFPNVSTDTVGDDSTNCAGTPTYEVYSLPLAGATSYSPPTYTQTTTTTTGSGKNSSSSKTTQTWTATYKIVDFSSDYYQPSASNGLNSKSALVQAVTGCMSPITQGSSGPGGLSGVSAGGITYYAGAIYAAQAALVAEQTAYPKAKNAIIFLSDGQANLVTTSDFPTTYTTTTTPQWGGTTTTTTIANSITSGSGYSALGGNGAGLYPDSVDECQQAIMAASAATAAGTTVYSVAYGSEQSGCTSGSGGTDTTLVAKGTYNVPVSLLTLTPCVAMEDIASTLDTFYSDYNQTGSGSTCQDASHEVTSLKGIFLSIAATFTTPRLLPNNAQ